MGRSLRNNRVIYIVSIYLPIKYVLITKDNFTVEKLDRYFFNQVIKVKGRKAGSIGRACDS